MESPIKVLLVDDEENFTATLSKRLVRRGFEVRVAYDAFEAGALMEDEPVEVVVLDMKMPGIDGLQALKRIKNNFPGVEVILLTGHAVMGDAIESMYSGAFDFLLKPASLELLVCKIQDAAMTRRLAQNGDTSGLVSHCKMD